MFKRILLTLFLCSCLIPSVFAMQGGFNQGSSSGGSVSNTAYGSSWDGVTTTAPSQNAVYDKIQTISGGSAGGSDTQVQFNDSTSFGGDSTFTFNKTSKVLSASSLATIGADGYNKILMSNNTSIAPTASSDEMYFEGNLFKVNENGVEKAVFARKWHIVILNPNVAITASVVVPIGYMDTAITIDRVIVNTSSASYEIAADLKYATARIGLGTPTVIQALDTTSGTLDIATAVTVTANKFVYISFDSAPNALMTDVTIDVIFHY